MAVQVVRYAQADRIRWGVITGTRITPLPGDFASTGEFLRAHPVASLPRAPEGDLRLQDVRLLSPVTTNQQFICQGANYRQHMVESGMDPDAKSFNMFFTKAASCLSAADADIVRPAHVRFLDYEVELGLVLSRDITQAVQVGEQDLPRYVAGLVIVNDVSARDVQIPQMQFYKGKSYRSFGPVGPWLCLLEPADFAWLHRLDLVLSVNGQVRQQDSTANLVWRPAETLTELSALQDLHAGDLLATGTPAGCALSVPSPAKQRLAALLPERRKWALFHKIQGSRPQYLQPGDVVEASIRSADGRIDLGVQRNLVTEA